MKLDKIYLKQKYGTYVVNLDEYESIRSHWIALYVKSDNVEASNDATYFDSFGVEHILNEIKKNIRNRNIKVNIFRVQEYDSVIRFFCIEFINFMLKGQVC